MGDEIKRILADLISQKLNDPRITSAVTITGVRLTNDLSTARVYYSVFGDDEARENAKDAFKSAGSFLRRELASQLRSRKVPRLIFEEDNTLRESEAIDQLIRRVREEDEAAARRRAENSESGVEDEEANDETQATRGEQPTT
jgi:ribosome-binding factor A